MTNLNSNGIKIKHAAILIVGLSVVAEKFNILSKIVQACIFCSIIFMEMGLWMMR
jgi:hypothetical protein